jgi:diguanylate cyclase (GGDEF)-like protein/PAS domain S-box-containing protein
MTPVSQGRSAASTPSPAPLLVLGETLYRQLVAHLPNAAVYLYDQDLRFVLADGEAMRVAGLNPADVIGRRLPEIVSERSRAVLEPAYREALLGRGSDFEHVGEDGHRWYRVRICPIRSDDGEVLGGLVVTDEITEQRKVAAELAKSQHVWRSLFEDAPVGMWLSAPGADSPVLEVNDALCTLLELSREEILASRKADLVQPVDAQELSEETARVLAGAKGSSLLTRHLPDGRVLHLSTTAKLIPELDPPRVLVHFVDVTAVKTAQEQLESSIAFREAILSAMPDGLQVVATDGTVAWSSRHQVDHLAQVHPDDMEALRRADAELAAAADGDVIHARHRTVAADGTVRWVDRRKTPFTRDGEGRLRQYVRISRDVTEQVAADHRLEEALTFQQAVLATSPDVVSVFDLDARQTVWVSRSLTDVLGYSLEDLQRLQRAGMSSLVHPEDLHEFDEAMAAVAAGPDGTVVHGANRVRAADGSWRTFARQSTPFHRDAAGRVTQVVNTARDVTEDLAAARDLEEVRAFQEAVIATTPDLIVILDARDGRPVWSSRPLENLLGWTQADLDQLGERPLEWLVHPEDLAAFRTAQDDVRRAGTADVVHLEYRARHRDGSWSWLSRRMIPFQRDADGTVTQLLTTVRDVTAVADAQRQLEHAALHDALTGLPNRRLVADRLRAAQARLEPGERIGVLYLDLDGFKRINDAHGHAAGDAVLRATAERMAAVVRPQDTVGRMGGDEFVVLLNGADPHSLAQTCQQLAQRLRREVALAVEHGGLLHTVTTSIGMAFADGSSDADAVLRDADTAMYQAKAAGKDRLSVFEPEHHAAALKRASIERTVRAAMSDGRIEVFFQPVMRLSTGQVEAVEALLRVPDGAGDYLDTLRAVLVAEQTGLIGAVGDTVRRLACARVESGSQDLRVAVNLSSREVALPGLHTRVSHVLDETGLDPARLILELTESVLLEASQETVRELERLREAGVGIAIDDFGTGYASLRYLAALPVSCVKVDRSFTAGLGTGSVAEKLAKATVGLAYDLGLDCVVEGIENQVQLDALGTAPHLLVQGYLLGAPAPRLPLGT